MTGFAETIMRHPGVSTRIVQLYKCDLVDRCHRGKKIVLPVIREDFTKTALGPDHPDVVQLLL
jgi:hypothetical protein